MSLFFSASLLYGRFLILTLTPLTLPRSSLGFCVVLLFFCGFFFIILLLFNLLGFWMQLFSSACVLSYKVQLGPGAVHFALQGTLEPFLDLGNNQHG